MGDRFQDIGKRIRQARKKKGLTQRELADLVHVSPSHMSDLELGKKRIGIDILINVTEVLQVSADWVLRTNVPALKTIDENELSEILSDCNTAEIQAIKMIASTTKVALRGMSKAKNDDR